jgi:trehalose synthase
MITEVEIPLTRSRADFFRYATFSAKQKKIFLAQAAFLRGKRIVHINATAVGGGVAEILQSLIPYTRSFGVDVRWFVINAKAPGKNFFSFTNRLHNALQGAPTKFSREDWKQYETVNKKIAAELAALDFDILVVHDPQPLLSMAYLPETTRALYFSHIDTSQPCQPVWDKLLPELRHYGFFVFSNKDFVNETLPHERVMISAPAIDPLAPKQRIVSTKNARVYLARYGIPTTGHLVVQVSRFDVWKNPLGVIEAFRLVQQQDQSAQLALVGFNEAKDNPEAARVYKDVNLIAKDDPKITCFFDPAGISVGEFTMMAQNAADIVVQNSIKEGFGLTVTEAMWKEKTVIGGPASGIRRQIRNGKNGFIVDTSEDLANRILTLLHDPKKRERIGMAAHRSVAKYFLMPRLVSDHFQLYTKLLK